VSHGVREIEHYGAEYVKITRNTTELVTQILRGGNGSKKKRVSVPLSDWLKISSSSYWNETYAFRVKEKKKEDEDDDDDLQQSSCLVEDARKGTSTIE